MENILPGKIYPLIYLALTFIYLNAKKSFRIWVLRLMYLYILSVFFIYDNNNNYFNLIKKGDLILTSMLIAFSIGSAMTFFKKKIVYYSSIIPLLIGCILSWLYGTQVGYYNPLFGILIPILAVLFYIPWSDKTIDQFKKNVDIKK